MLTSTETPWPVVGHDWAVDHLRRGMANRRVRHAYLFLGPESIGKLTLARAFAAALNCAHDDLQHRPCGACSACQRIASGNHPDVIYAQPDPATGTLKIEEVRSITARIALKPFEARFRIAILPSFERAQPRAQDALLKTLEEPPPHAILILTAPSSEPILPTIISRSQVLRLRPLPPDLVATILEARFGADRETALLLGRISGGRLGWAIEALTDPDRLLARREALDLLARLLFQNRTARFEEAEKLAREKAELTALLDLWQMFWRDALLMAAGAGMPIANIDRREELATLVERTTAAEILTALRATQAALAALNTNANARLAVEVMLLDYPGLRSA
ncbi:MAG: DNA polymerase III subunit [Aggregatilineales bacterium]